MGERERGPEPADGADPAHQLDTPPAPAADPAAAPGPALTALSDSPLRLAHRRGRQAADLRQKLDEKAAATDELREALHELRQVLDVDNPPPHENPRHRGARLAALALVLVLAAALLMWLLFDH